LDSDPSKARFRKGWKPETARWAEGPTAAFYALQGPRGERQGIARPKGAESLKKHLQILSPGTAADAAFLFPGPAATGKRQRKPQTDLPAMK